MRKQFLKSNGIKWADLIPISEMGLVSELPNASLADTIREIPRVVSDYKHQLAKVAPHFRGNDLKKVCKNVFDWCYGNFQYRHDQAGFEQLKSPSYSFHRDRFMERGIDCDDFVVLVSSLLCNLTIPHSMVVIRQPGDKPGNFSHIYVRVPVDTREYYTIDPVLSRFNQEAKYIEAKTYPIISYKQPLKMKLQVLNGAAPSSLKAGTLGALRRKMTKAERGQQMADKYGVSVDDLVDHRREEFIKKFGMTPEEKKALDHQAFVNRPRPLSKAQIESVERLRSALDKRGVWYSKDAPMVASTLNNLLKLANTFPAPKPGGQVLNNINKFNPAALAMRKGVALAIKVNLFKVASRVRFGYAPDLATAQKWGFIGNQLLLDNRTKALQSLMKIYRGTGGDLEHLRDAIVSGKGNKKQDQQLGEAATAAIIPVAVAALGVINALLNKGENGGAKEDGSSDGSLDYQGNTETGLTKGEDDEGPTNDPIGRTKASVLGWARKNWPVLAGGGAIAAGIGYYLWSAQTTKPLKGLRDPI